MKKFKVGLQLYSVRGDMEKDFYGTLKAVKEAGYDYVEFAGYFGRTAEEVKAMLDELGLECCSVHQDPNLFLEKGQEAVDFLKVIGAKYSAIPWYGVENYLNGNFDATIEKFRKVGELLAANGIQLTYHNHDLEFQYLDGEFILDRIYAALPGLIQGEIDTFWVKYVGVDPVALLDKYSGTMKTIHLKDFAYNVDDSGKAGNGFDYRPLGMGMLDTPSILEAAERGGIEYIIVEQNESKDMPSLEAARKSREYLKTLGQ